VQRSTGEQGAVPDGRFVGSDLAERMRNVRKRRRAFCGRTIDAQAVKRRLGEGQRRDHDP
jgi:hypothetical protein